MGRDVKIGIAGALTGVLASTAAAIATGDWWVVAFCVVTTLAFLAYVAFPGLRRLLRMFMGWRLQAPITRSVPALHPLRVRVADWRVDLSRVAAGGPLIVGVFAANSTGLPLELDAQGCFAIEGLPRPQSGLVQPAIADRHLGPFERKLITFEQPLSSLDRDALLPVVERGQPFIVDLRCVQLRFRHGARVIDAHMEFNGLNCARPVLPVVVGVRHEVHAQSFAVGAAVIS